MDKLERQLNLYDRFLRVKRSLDGTVKVYRLSPFSRRQYDVLTIQNKYRGSCKWILREINLKDSQRHNIAGSVYKQNIYKRMEREDDRTHQEIADFMLKDQIVF